MNPSEAPIPPSSPLLTPLIIAISIVAITALTLIAFHLLITRLCSTTTRSVRGQRATGGVDRTTLDSIPISPYTKSEEELECAVCLGVLEPGELVRVLPRCHHVFHVSCIDGWFNCHSACPLCRTVVIAAATSEAVLVDIDVLERSVVVPVVHDDDEGYRPESLGRSGSLLWPFGASGLLLPKEKLRLKRFSSMHGLSLDVEDV